MNKLLGALQVISKTIKESDNEATQSPYWLILDPGQNMSCSIHQMAGGITGPFFSREDAEKFLKMTRYNFSPRAKVYCLSGHNSNKYHSLCKILIK